MKNHTTSEKSPRYVGPWNILGEETKQTNASYGISKLEKNTYDIINISTVLKTGQMVTLFSLEIFSLLL